MITNYTAAKNRKLDFEPRTLQLKYTDIVTIMNELALNQLIHIHVFLSDVIAEMTKWKDGKFLKIKKAKLFDKIGFVKLTIFNDFVKSIVENKGLLLTYLRVGKYENQKKIF